jgi:hypothetical protein
MPWNRVVLPPVLLVITLAVGVILVWYLLNAFGVVGGL